MTSGGLQVEVGDGRLRIVREGRVPKFVADVQMVCASGARAVANGQEIMFVTERAVFRQTPDGIVLTEVAPGIDVQTEVLDRGGSSRSPSPPTCGRWTSGCSTTSRWGSCSPSL